MKKVSIKKNRDGAFGETVFRHKDTKTLIVTDTVLEVAEEVPEICELEPSPLLYHARDTVTQKVENTPEVRKIGWRRIALFGLFFTPSAIDIKDAGVAFQERRPDIDSGFLGIYPCECVLWFRVVNFVVFLRSIVLILSPCRGLGSGRQSQL